MKRTMILFWGLFLLSSARTAPAPTSPNDTLVVFWNIENFFEPHSPAVNSSWTNRRFFAKCEGLCKTFMLIAEQYGKMPDLICLAEVENRTVLNRLLRSTLLRKAGYSIIHYDSADHRGIDCAILCRNATMQPVSSAPKHLYDSTGTIMPTRDILLAQFDSLSVLVNHHPSKVGGGKSAGRIIAMNRMKDIADSLLKSGAKAVLSVGDFNDNVWSSDGVLLQNPTPTYGNTLAGTIKYNGEWEKIDGCFIFGNLHVKEYIFDSPLLLEQDKKFGGLKPRRTFIGPRCNGGLSDHLPVVFVISQE